MIKAEKLKNYDPTKIREGYMSVKKNGIHAIFDPKSTDRFYSRTPRKIHGLEHLEYQLEGVHFPLVGELVIPGMPFEDMSGKIRSFHSTPDAEFHIFNSIIPGVPFVDRFRSLNRIRYQLVSKSPHVKFVTFYYCSKPSQLNSFYENILEDEEGVCWISCDHIYTPGKRSWNWMKRVPMRSVEVQLMDILPGTPGKKYEHSMGRMECRLANGKMVRVGIFKGRDDLWREGMLEAKFDFIGEFLTIEYKDLSKNGIPVQPRFKGFRWDL